MANERTFIDLSMTPSIGCCGIQGPCESGKQAIWRRQNTAYYDDEMNWICACDDCMDIINELWQEQWNEYHSSMGC